METVEIHNDPLAVRLLYLREYWGLDARRDIPRLSEPPPASSRAEDHVANPRRAATWIAAWVNVWSWNTAAQRAADRGHLVDLPTPEPREWFAPTVGSKERELFMTWLQGVRRQRSGAIQAMPGHRILYVLPLDSPFYEEISDGIAVASAS